MTRSEWQDLPLAERIWRVGFAIGMPFMFVGGLFGLSGNLGTFRSLSIVGILIFIPSLLAAFAVERWARRTRDGTGTSDTG